MGEADENVYLKDVLNPEFVSTNPAALIRDAARVMAKDWNDPLPVVDNGRLIGVLTSRIIVCEVVAPDRLATAVRVRDVMSPPISFCYDTQTVIEAWRLMIAQYLHRMIVVNAQMQVVGTFRRVDLQRLALEENIHEADKHRTYPDVLGGSTE